MSATYSANITGGTAAAAGLDEELRWEGREVQTAGAFGPTLLAPGSTPGAADPTGLMYEPVLDAGTELPRRIERSPAPREPLSRGIRLSSWREAARGLDSICVDPNVMGGEPTITGTTITVAQIQQLAGEGMSAGAIAAEFPGVLTETDVQQAFVFAVRLTR